MADPAYRRTHAPTRTTALSPSLAAAVDKTLRTALSQTLTFLASITTKEALKPCTKLRRYQALRRFSGPALSFRLSFGRA